MAKLFSIFYGTFLMFHRTQHWSLSPLAYYDILKGDTSFGKSHYLKWDEGSGYIGQNEMGFIEQLLNFIKGNSQKKKKKHLTVNVYVCSKCLSCPNMLCFEYLPCVLWIAPFPPAQSVPSQDRNGFHDTKLCLRKYPWRYQGSNRKTEKIVGL